MNVVYKDTYMGERYMVDNNFKIPQRPYYTGSRRFILRYVNNSRVYGFRGSYVECSLLRDKSLSLFVSQLTILHTTHE